MLNLILMILLNFVVGGCIGLTGIAGFLLPMFYTGFLDMPSSASLALSFAAFLISGILGSVNYYKSGNLDLKTAGVLSAGSFVGALAGVKINLLIPADTMKIILYLVVLLSGISILLRKDKPGNTEKKAVQSVPFYLVLGAVTGAVCAASGRRIYVATPSNRSHLPLAQTFGLTPLPWEERHSVPALLVVNTTPLGMCGKAGTATPYDFAQAPLPHCQQDDFFDGTAAQATPLAYDLVYNPLETRFLREARLAGRRGISGLEMFYGQGDAQFRLWTGRALPPQARQALDAALKVKEIPCV